VGQGNEKRDKSLSLSLSLSLFLQSKDKKKKKKKKKNNNRKKQTANFHREAIKEIATRCNEDDDQIKMKKFVTNFRILPSMFLILLSLLAVAVSKTSTELVERNLGGTPMHSVQLTQKGYIQVRI